MDDELAELLGERATIDDRIKQARQRRALEARPRHEAQLDDIFNTLRERRLALGMTQAEVADLCSLSRAQITNAESGSTNMSMRAFVAYVDAVQCQLRIVET